MACFTAIYSSLLDYTANIPTQRFKDAVDTRIQEEQARQKSGSPAAGTASPRASTSTPRPRSGSRNISPSRRRRKEQDGGPTTATMPSGKEPDPSEFEPEFVIGDESDVGSLAGLSRVATPVPAIAVTPAIDVAPTAVSGEGETVIEEKAEAAGDGEAKDQSSTAEESIVTRAPPQIPAEVQLRLRKLDRLEPKYTELLKSYRLAHARNKFIEPFENALRENTPLTSIAEPTALIEFLAQSNLKTSMVLDEMKRIATERDDLKKMLEESVRESKSDRDELVKLRADKAAAEEVSSKPVAPEKKQDGDGEDFFSYESELPRLQEEVQEYEVKMRQLKEENEKLSGDLTSAKESAEGLAKDLEESTREVQIAREKDTAGTRSSGENARWQSLMDELTAKLEATEKDIESQKSTATGKSALIAELRRQAEEAAAELETMRSSHAASAEQTSKASSDLEVVQKQLADVTASQVQAQKRNTTLDNLLSTLREQLKTAQDEKARLDSEVGTLRKELDLRSNPATNGASTPTISASAPVETANGSSAASKKKNKKKKKGGAAKADTDTTPGTPAEPTELPIDDAEAESMTVRLMAQLHGLEAHYVKKEEEYAQKDAQITRLEAKLKDQEALQEEIESLRDDLSNFGAEHVDAKDQIKTLTAEKAALQKTLDELEREMERLKISHIANAGSAEKHESLNKEFEELKGKADTLQADLSAAQQLAASRFKDLTDLREIMQKAQPELTSLRTEVAELRKSKVELAARNTEVRRLEAREKDLRAEVTRFTSQMRERDQEVRSLNDKIGQGNSQKNTLEESVKRVQRELQRAQTEKNEGSDARAKVQRDLAAAQADVESSRSTAQRLEQALKKLEQDASGLREELQLKSAQYSSAQSLMNSMRDQSAEIGAQMKEVRERCESLEEELAEAHRLLSERSREGETMRRLLNESDGRAESRVKEMRARMDVAIEERDRAEEQASSMGRRRARELDELKAKVADTSRALTRAIEEKESLSRSEAELRRQKEDIERRIRGDEDEVKEVRTAMGQLREALDETEKQCRDLERERNDLKRSVEETSAKLDKVTKSSKLLSDELKATRVRTTIEPSLQGSTRSSIESSRSPSRLGSPVPPGTLGKGRIGSIAGSEIGSGGQAQMDYVYLKNVLLQFLEQRDKRHQMQLIPVLGMLLHFDKKDEARWVSAVGAR